MLAADGVDVAGTQALRAAITKAGATVRVVAPHLGNLRGAGGDALVADDLLVTMPSVVFDAVIVAPGAGSVTALKGSGSAVHFVRKAFKHAKAVAAPDDEFFVAIGILVPGAARPDGVSSGRDPVQLTARFLDDVSTHRHWARLGKDAVAA